MVKDWIRTVPDLRGCWTSTMKSPFPGMNPYLEQDDAWHDFHEQFCMDCRKQIVPQVEPKYIAKLDQHVYIHEVPEQRRRLAGRGDVTVARTGEHGAVAVLDRPVARPVMGTLLPEVDVLRESRIEIRDRLTRDVVTVIEILSPSNKEAGGDRSQYLRKRFDVIQSPANLVEIDLLRGGSRLPIGDLPESDYYVLLSRARNRPQVEFWPIALRERLPIVPIPLKDDDADATLDLQQALNEAYETGGYRSYIYGGSPSPRLSHADAKWAAELLNREKANP